MPHERAIVRAPMPLTPDSPRHTAGGDSPWRDDAYAVVIGINEYVDPNIPNLRFARADAEAIHDVLIDPAIGRFKPENVRLLVDSEATERNIRSALGTQLPRRAGHDSTVVIYFAGHGAPVVDTRAHSADGLEKYLIPHDAVADDLRATGISMDTVQQYFSWLDASQVVCFLDSCYSGTAGGRSFDNPSFQTRAMLSDEFLDSLGSEGRFVVTACAANEVSLEDPKLGHGIFTQRLVEGLRGAADTDADGRVTIDELYEYVYKNVERDARSLGGSMNPVKKGSVQGRIYITEYETESKRRVRELLHSASDARTRRDNSGAVALYREVLALDPTNVEASDASAAAAALERQRDAGVKRQQRVLLGHVNSGDLTMREYNRALSSLDADPASLEGNDLQYRRLVDGVMSGELTIRSFNRSVELLDTGTAEHSQPAAPSPVLRPQPMVEEKRTPAISVPSETPNHSVTGNWRKLMVLGGVVAAAGVIAFLALRPHPVPVPAPVAPSSASAPDTLRVPARSPETAAPSTTVSPPVPRRAVEGPLPVPLNMPTVVSTNNPIHPWHSRQRIVLAFADLAKNDTIDVESIFKRVVVSGGGRTVDWGMLVGAGGANTVTLAPNRLQDNTKYTVQVLPGIRSKRGRILVKGGTNAFTTPVIDTSYTYQLINASRASALFFAENNVCQIGKGRFMNQDEWYFTVSSHQGYYIIHYSFSEDTTAALEGLASPQSCRLSPTGGAPSTSMFWKLVPVPGARFQFFLQNMSFGAAQSLAAGPTDVPTMQATDSRNPGQIWTVTRSNRRGR